MTFKFNDNELSVLRLLAESHHSGNGEVTQMEVKSMIGDADAEILFSRLGKYEMIHWPDNTILEATKPLLQYLHQLDNPQVPNRWNEFREWWFSSYWFTGVTVFAVVIPVVWTWIQIAIASSNFLNSSGK